MAFQLKSFIWRTYIETLTRISPKLNTYVQFRNRKGYKLNLLPLFQEKG